MDRFARTALRLSLAGAGVVVLGAGFVGHASADDEPTAVPHAETVTNVVAHPLGATDEA